MIVFHTTKYGETSLIVHGYTREYGRCGFLLRGGKNNARKRLLHPLSILNYVVSENPRGNLLCLKEYTPRYALNSIRTDFNKSSIVLFLSELLYRNLLLSGEDVHLYDFLEDAILKLERREEKFANFHLWFLLHYCRMLGFPPEEGFQNEFNPFSEEQRIVARILIRSDYDEAMKIPMTGASRADLLKALIRYIEFHTGTRLDLHSLAVLQEINKKI